MLINLHCRKNINTSNKEINKHAKIGKPIDNLYQAIGRENITLTSQDVHMSNQDEKILIYVIDNNQLMIIRVIPTMIKEDVVDIITDVMVMDQDKVIDRFNKTYFKTINASGT